VTRRSDLATIEQSLTRIGRIGQGREAARLRAERSGVQLSRPGISILAALRVRGSLRLSDLGRATSLEAPLISREVRGLVEGGYVHRTPDPSDGRAGIVELTASGHEVSERYREATEGIIAETFDGWSAGDLKALAGLLERVAADFARPGGSV
jgi:DNA-binding MarR family transcriptional regulator